MLSSDKITEIFFVIDEFCKNFNKVVSAHTIKQDNGKKTRNRKSILSDSEVMTILILFHSGGYKNLKHFYIYYVQEHMKKEFPETVAYNRFVELQKGNYAFSYIPENMLFRKMYRDIIYWLNAFKILSY